MCALRVHVHLHVQPRVSFLRYSLPLFVLGIFWLFSCLGVLLCFVLFCSRVNLLSPTSEFRAKAVSVQLC